MNSPILTILTCTYNRRPQLEKLYSSIIEQSDQSEKFTWLVIDDGSTDGSAAYLADLERRHPGLIHHVAIPNGGKCRALNFAMSHIVTEWFVVVDSDDYMLPQAIQNINDAIHERADDSVGMIAGLLQFSDKNKPKFSIVRNPCSYTEWVSGQGMFDFSPILRSRLARQYAYPVCPGEKFMAEGWRYDQIAKAYKTYFLNKEIVHADYLGDGLSAKSLELRVGSPLNAMKVYASQLDSDYRPGLKVRAAINFWRFYFHARHVEKDASSIKKPSVLWALPGLAYYWFDILMVRS